MLIYAIGNRLRRCGQESDAELCAMVCSPDELANVSHLPEGLEDLCGSLNGAHATRVYSAPDHLLFTFLMPRGDRAQQPRFACCLERNRVLFVENSGQIGAVLEQMLDSRGWKHPSVARFFADMLDFLLESDVSRLEDLENRLAQQEEEALGQQMNGALRREMSGIRRELLTLWHYYRQLLDAVQLLCENENGLWTREEVPLWQSLHAHVQHMANYVQMLRDQSIQVQELFQSQISIQQNRIMGILTVVTVLFLPLTLLTSWYGMNFERMPELSWAWGYPLVIALALMLLGIGIWVIWRKKLF